jgi:topoisomerase-4 subunit A
VFFDEEGKVYALPGHALPSARGQGEPLTGKLNPAEGVGFAAIIGGEPEQKVVLASDSGYGFIAKLGDLYVKNRNGKACIKLTAKSTVLPPRLIVEEEECYVACATNTGRLLLFPAAELPVLARGKGNKLINIPTAKSAAREEYIVDIQVLSLNQSLTVYAGKRQFTLKGSDLSHYVGERGRKGSRLPRGLHHVTQLEVLS